jgi:hypothetical protein
MNIYILVVALGASFFPVDSFATLASCERAIVEMHQAVPSERLRCERKGA